MSKREENKVSELQLLRLENEMLRKEILFYSAKAFEAEQVAEIFHYLLIKKSEEKLISGR